MQHSNYVCIMELDLVAGEEIAHCDAVLPRHEPEAQKASITTDIPDIDYSNVTTMYQQVTSSAGRISERSGCSEVANSPIGDSPVSRASTCSMAARAMHERSSKNSRRGAQWPHAAVSVLLTTARDGSEHDELHLVQLHIHVHDDRPAGNSWFRMNHCAPDSMRDRGLRINVPGCEITTISEVNSSVERHTQRSERSTQRAEHVHQEDMWESISTTTVASASELDGHNPQLHAEPSRMSTTSVLLSEGVNAPLGNFTSPSENLDVTDKPSAGCTAPVNDAGPGHAPDQKLVGDHEQSSAEVRTVQAPAGVLKGEEGAWYDGGGREPSADTRHHSRTLQRARPSDHDTHPEGVAEGWGIGGMPMARAPEEGLRTALAEMEVEAAVLQLHEVVGRGAFGCVYRGTWRGLNVRFCLPLVTVIFPPSDRIRRLKMSTSADRFQSNYMHMM